ncbi:MAG: hypothetical protein GQ535_17545 [Rhodobacteraceae bacterium]|nr:hypothetical protein [Paracoccaceae bacterium]
MKKLIATSVALISATAATAGSVIYTPPAVTGIEAPERMGSSGAWIIPLIIAAVVLLAITQQDDPVAPVNNGRN